MKPLALYVYLVMPPAYLIVIMTDTRLRHCEQMGGLVSKEREEIEKRIFSQPLSIIIPKLSYSRRLERAWQLIERHYDTSNLSLEKAAMISGLNKNHLNMLFRQATNFTFHQFLIRYRILRAISMMEMMNHNLLEIALQNGFGSLTYFRKEFSQTDGQDTERISENLDF